MLKAIVNNQDTFELNSQLTEISNTSDQILVEKHKKGGYCVELNGKKVYGDIVDINEETKIITVLVHNNKYEVQIKEPIDQLFEQLGMVKKATRKNNGLVSPMPGLILSIPIKVGDAVKKGETLILLEAMKMENAFKATSDVVIASIEVTEKQAVEKGQVLIKFA